jgi:hypothetical protein
MTPDVVALVLGFPDKDERCPRPCKKLKAKPEFQHLACKKGSAFSLFYRRRSRSCAIWIRDPANRKQRIVARMFFAYSREWK